MLTDIKRHIKKTKIYTLYQKRKEHKASDKNNRLLNEEFKFSMNSNPDSPDSLYGKIRVRIHSLEKSLVKGNLPKPESVLNIFPLTEKLVNNLPGHLKSKVGGKEIDAVVETIGIAKSVINANQSAGINCTNLEKELEAFIQRNGFQHVSPRNIVISKVHGDDMPQNVSAYYDDFVKNRHSVREFLPKVIEEEILNGILETALICPSACNRQPCKVYYSKNSEKIRKFFPDKGVTKDIYNLLIVTVNKSFYNTGELFQCWIDGGIFVESLVMAIHSRGLGSCPFQYVKTHPHYFDLKEKVGIPENEDIICCVGMGYLKDEYSIIETHRKSVSEMMVEY